MSVLERCSEPNHIKAWGKNASCILFLASPPLRNKGITGNVCMRNAQ